MSFSPRYVLSRARHARPRLERLEDRTAPAVSLSAGVDVNVSKLTDSQAEATIAIDPNNPLKMFTASVNAYGGYSGTPPTAPFTFQPGLYAASSLNGGGP